MEDTCAGKAIDLNQRPRTLAMASIKVSPDSHKSSGEIKMRHD